MLSALGEHQRAIRFCTDAVSLCRPDDPEPFIARTYVYLADQKAPYALMDADEAVQRGGGIKAYQARIKTNIILELWYQAIHDLTMTIQLNPEDYSLLEERAYCLQQLGLHERAIEDRVHALRIKGDCHEAIVAFERESLNH